MHRRVLLCFLILLTSFFCLFAEDEDDEWFWNHPITRIEFNGLKNVRKSDLAGISGTFINEEFDEEVYNDILDRLYALDFFDDITPYAKHDPKNDGGVLLVFEVVERPVIKSINFVGNKRVRNGELREQIKLKSSDIYIESKVLVDERNIKNYLHKKGYTTSTVTYTTVEKEGGIEINFIIQEGSNTVIREIIFTGNTIVSKRTLKNKIQSKEVGLFKDGAYQPATLEQDKLKIIEYYKNHGYADVSIVDVKIDTILNEEKQRNELVINFIIQEGVQYTYAGLKLSGNEVFSDSELIRQRKLRVGSVYNETKFQEEENQRWAKERLC